MKPNVLECAESLAMHLRHFGGVEINALTVLAACKASDEQLAAKYGSPDKFNELDEAEDDLYVAAIKWDMFETPENTAALHIATSRYRELLDEYLEKHK